MKTNKFDAASYLDTEEKIAAYLNEVMEINDPALTAEAIGTVAKARGMSEIAKEANVTRESLYKSLSLRGNPELKTVTKVLGSMGMRLRVIGAGQSAARAAMKGTPVKTKTKKTASPKKPAQGKKAAAAKKPTRKHAAKTQHRASA